MPNPRLPVLLEAFRNLADEHRTNPYQIAKASGLGLATVQRLLTGKVSPSIQNIETALAAFGVEVRVVKAGKALVKPGTGRGHGLSPGKRRGK
jgi:transcriptional regulator with XRE-family HTH domain